MARQFIYHMRELSKTYGSKKVLDNINLSFYPDAKIGVLEAAGYTVLGYFPLPEPCWLDNYYRPLEARFEAFLAAHDQSVDAQKTVATEREEIALHERYSDAFGYGYYVARKRAD